MKSATTALINGLALGSAAACASSALLANDSFRRPHSPVGSAAVMAIPAFMGLLKSSAHSSLVKLVLSAIESLLQESTTAHRASCFAYVKFKLAPASG